MGRAVRALAAGALCGIVLAACSGSASKIVAGPTTTSAVVTTASTVAGTPTTTTTAGPATPLVGGGTAPVSTPAQNHAKLVAVRVGDQGGFDRVTFEFQGGLPGYSVRFTPRPIQEDPSGKEVAVQGDNVLAVHLSGASGVDLSGGKVTQTYTGPTRFAATTPSVAELVLTGDFEDVLSWAVGTHGKPAFKVGVDAAGQRVIVDIAH